MKDNSLAMQTTNNPYKLFIISSTQSMAHNDVMSALSFSTSSEWREEEERAVFTNQ